MKHKKVMELKIEEIKRDLQERRRSHLEEREEEKLEQPCTVKSGEKKPSLVFTTEEKIQKFSNTGITFTN
jgi:hypothetical protein